jgi:hypothetical protein
MALIGLFVAKAAPIAIGIYLIATSLFSFLEELGFRLYLKQVTGDKSYKLKVKRTAMDLESTNLWLFFLILGQNYILLF